MRHCMLLLSIEQLGMALGANRCSYIGTPWSVTFTRPPARLHQMLVRGHLRGGSRRHFGRDGYQQKENTYKDTYGVPRHMRAES